MVYSSLLLILESVKEINTLRQYSVVMFLKCFVSPRLRLPLYRGDYVSYQCNKFNYCVLFQQQKFGCGDYEPPSKIQCSAGAGGGSGGGGGNGEALTKFSVEIVQQLEFTTSTADSQPQQISTNVTVKALANAVKTSNSPPPPPRAPSPLDADRECKTECKSEVADDEFVGLDECAAAIERDGASSFPGLADLIGEDDGDEITSFEDLITEISEYPEFMKDFDLDGGAGKGHGLEPPEGETAPRAYGGGEMSPAAQTLKHMAEQHQQATGGDWARYRFAPGAGTAPGPGYRPRAPQEHLHLTQHQQMHLSQAHQNLQVSLSFIYIFRKVIMQADSGFF